MLTCVYHHDHGIWLLRNNSMGPRIKEWLAWGKGGSGSRALTGRSAREGGGDSAQWPRPPEGDGRGATRGRSAGEEGGVSAQWPRPRAVLGEGKAGLAARRSASEAAEVVVGPAGGPGHRPRLGGHLARVRLQRREGRRTGRKRLCGDTPPPQVSECGPERVSA